MSSILRPFALTSSSRALQHLQRRPNSTDRRQAAPGPQANFYKQFARPLSKVVLMAVFTSQFVYWAWAKMEKDEAQMLKKGEVEGLERTLEELVEGKRKGL